MILKFDADNRVQDFTYVLSLRTHDHLGQIRNINPEDVVIKINMNAANEFSLVVYKEDNGYIEPLWDEITDFKYIYVKELDEYFEIKVEHSDAESVYKTITATSACEAELSQSYVYNLEINTEADIARTDYTAPTVFYNPSNPDCSLLNRVLYKMPHYSIKYVDTSLMNIQRTFSADGTDVYSLLTNDIAEEIGCLFTFDSTNRSISVYDLKTVCIDCGERGEFSDVCPKCGSTDIRYYGEDTTIYIDTENLAEDVTLTVDTDRVKNCFKLEAGDDNMTAAVVNLNPNGSDYIYYFSEEQKKDMPAQLVAKMESYDELVASYEDEYAQVVADMYEAIDQVVYYTSGMMPTQEDDPTNAELEAAKLTEAAMSPMSLTDVTSSTSTATVNTALKNYAKVFVKSGYFKIEINEGEFTYEGVYTGEDGEKHGYGYWYGNFKITNYSDDEDVATSEMIRVNINADFDTFMDQKIKKKLALDSEEDGSIFDVLSIEDLDAFKDALTYYGLNRLTSFYDAVQGCLDIMIEMNQAKENADLYESMYLPYYDKLDACQSEINERQATIDRWYDKLDAAENRKKAMQKILNFENYLGEEMFKDFCCYKREDKYSNENYISDGLENDEVFERAREFLEAAKAELVKSGENQRQLSATVANLLCMDEFEPIKDYFQVGNFIRVGIDGQVYRLRLISYQISFGSIQNIGVEFSDVTKTYNGMSDLQGILSQANSMASSYGATVHQVEKSAEKTALVGNWVNSGFDATAVKIVNNADNQNITIGESGLLAKRKDDFYEKYDDTQLKLLSTGLYVTDNAWRSTKAAIGKYYYTDPKTGKQISSYGVLADSIVGQIILGNELGLYSYDESAEMSFDNGGLVLNAKNNGTGQYKRIFDIQKDGVSQLYVDTDGNIVLAKNQVVQIFQNVEQLNVYNFNAEKLYAKTGTIDALYSEKATVDEIDSTLATIDTLNVSDLKGVDAHFSGTVTIDTNIDVADGEFNTLKVTESATIASLEATDATIGSVDSYKVAATKLIIESDDNGNGGTAAIPTLTSDDATIQNFVSLNATITNLDVINLDVSNKTTTKLAEVTEELTAQKAVVDELIVSDDGLATIPYLTSTKVITTNIDADNGDIEVLNSTSATLTNSTITNLNVPKGGVGDIYTLNSNHATIELLDASVINVDTLQAENLEVEELNAAIADIGELEAQVANIHSIMAGNIGAGLVQTIHLTGKNAIIDDALITDAMIKDLTASKITAGNINTNKVAIQSEDGSMVLQGSLQQFIDENGIVRIQQGKDADGNFTFVLYDKTGKGVLINSEGVQSSDALADGLIVDSKIASDAAIQGSKLDINSVVTEINNGTNTIKATKIWIDEENQSLGAKFDKIEEALVVNGGDLTKFIEQTTKNFEDLQGQIDGSIQTYFYDYEPTNDNIPASEWTTEELKKQHLGNMFYDTITGYSYRWQVSGNEYAWKKLEDSDVAKALEAASKAQDTADHKRRVFVDTPTTPYDVGDLWCQGSIGDLMKCKVAKTAEQSYALADWELASKYTDDTLANQVQKNVDDLAGVVSKKVSQTDFEIEQGRINALIKETTTIQNEDGTTIALKDKYLDIDATVDGIKTTIGDATMLGEGETLVGAITIIEATTDGLKTTVTKAGEDATSAKSVAEQAADKLTWLVKSGTDESNFELTPRTANLVADAINLQGLVAFSGLNSDVPNKILEPLGTEPSENSGTTIIHGGYIQSETIKANQLNIEDVFATGNAVMNIINAQDINADRITSGTVQSNFLSLYGMEVKQKGTDITTLYIEDTGDVTMRGTLESYNYHSGKSGWAIKASGDAEFNDIISRGSIITNDGGIVSSGGSGTNILLNSSFAKKVEQISWDVTLNGKYTAEYWGGFNGNVQNKDKVYHAHLYELDGEWVYRYVDNNSEWLGISQDVTGLITVGNTYTFSCDLRRTAGSNTSMRIGLYTYLNDGTYGFKSGNANVKNTLDDTWERITYTFTVNADTDETKDMKLYIYGHYGDNGTMYMRRPKLEEGNIATAWSLSPKDTVKQVRFWAGSTYNERENAPWIVYNDGSMVATKGTFGGVFTGNIAIGNISIIDPSKQSGNDAILTIQNGQTGVKTVQLGDTNQSDFAQNINITDNFYNSQILLGQDGIGTFASGIIVGNSSKYISLDDDSIKINGSEINASSGTINVLSNDFKIGSASSNNNLEVWGLATFKKDMTILGDINIGNKWKVNVSSNGIDIDFVK